jgi:hypothetical protein
MFKSGFNGNAAPHGGPSARDIWWNKTAENQLRARSIKMMDNPKRAPNGHGGKRPGAGRKRKVLAATALEDNDVRLLTSDSVPKQVETEAQRHAGMAIAALVKKLVVGANEAARVSAANEILDRGYGKPAVEAGGDAILPFAPMPVASSVRPEMRAEARKYALLALEVLRRIAEFGRSESASVSACKSLLDRALGKVAPAKVPDEFVRTLGKREQAAEDAHEAATGIFATPAAPGEETKH